MKKSERLLYEPPRARDLSAFGVSGQIGPLGMCVDGSELTFEVCTPLGDFPGGGVCSPNGLLPDIGYCDLGQVAVEGCVSGGKHF